MRRRIITNGNERTKKKIAGTKPRPESDKADEPRRKNEIKTDTIAATIDPTAEAASRVLSPKNRVFPNLLESKYVVAAKTAATPITAKCENSDGV